jgi:exopolysaccharide biosynthesis polyprenyl glycosylphosphotransferase
MDGRWIEGPRAGWRKLDLWGDVALLVLISSAVTLQGEGLSWRIAVGLLAVSVALWLAARRGLGRFAPGNDRDLLDVLALGTALLAAVVVPLGALSMIVPDILSTEQASRILLAFLAAVLLLRARDASRRLLRANLATPVLIVGTGPLGRSTGREMGQRVQSRPVLGYLAFDDEAPHERLRAPVIAQVDGLELALRERVVGEVYFASTAGEHAVETQSGIRTCEKLGVPFALPVCAYRLTRTHMVGPASDGYVHFLAVPVKPLQRAAKRVFDILASGAALVALTPLFLATALAIKATSRGPVLFKQERSGLHGRKFSMLKFRSMVANAEELRAILAAQNEQSGPVFKMKLDPRVTRVGRFIRKYSIDELPQLVNVFLGDMSVVGPRPPLPAEVMKYEGWQFRRLSVRPGLTCVWQVSGRNEISFNEWMLLDMRYIDHWSLFGDFDLIWRTIPVVLLGRGAS